MTEQIKPGAPSAAAASAPAMTPLDLWIRTGVDRVTELLMSKMGVKAVSGMRASRKMDHLPSGDISICLGFAGQSGKGSVILSFPKAVFSNLFSKFCEKPIDLASGAPDELIGFTQELGVAISIEARAKGLAFELALPVCCVGKEVVPGVLANLGSVAIPFEVPGGIFFAEFTLAAQSDVKLRVPQEIRILVADDSQIARKGVTRFLNALGFANIVEHRDGEAALAGIMGGLSINKPFDLVLCDLHMPKMSGVELLKKLRSNEKTRHIKFILFTGDQDVENVKQAMVAGVNSYLVKPVTQDVLGKKIEAVWNANAPGIAKG